MPKQTFKQDFLNSITSLQISISSSGRYHRASHDLHAALKEIEVELLRPRTNWRLIAALTGVKSYIAGKAKGVDGVNHFWSRINGPKGPYSVLDGLHFEASFKVNQMPSGMTEFTANGARSGEVDTSFNSPTLKLIAEEHAAIVEHCRQEELARQAPSGTRFPV